MDIDERGLYDIYVHWHIPFWKTGLFLGVLIFLFSLIIVGVVIFGVRSYLRRRRIVTVTPWDYALQKVATLELRPCVTKLDGKQVYGTLAYEMKQYVFKRYSYDVRWKTDEELIDFLENHEFSEELLADLREIMMGSTLVKFANIEVIQEQTKRHLAMSKAFIQKTIPQKIQ